MHTQFESSSQRVSQNMRGGQNNNGGLGSFPRVEAQQPQTRKRAKAETSKRSTHIRRFLQKPSAQKSMKALGKGNIDITKYKANIPQMLKDANLKLMRAKLNFGKIQKEPPSYSRSYEKLYKQASNSIKINQTLYESNKYSKSLILDLQKKIIFKQKQEKKLRDKIDYLQKQLKISRDNKNQLLSQLQQELQRCKQQFLYLMDQHEQLKEKQQKNRRTIKKLRLAASKNQKKRSLNNFSSQLGSRPEICQQESEAQLSAQSQINSIQMDPQVILALCQLLQIDSQSRNFSQKIVERVKHILSETQGLKESLESCKIILQMLEIDNGKINDLLIHEATTENEGLKMGIQQQKEKQSLHQNLGRDLQNLRVIISRQKRRIEEDKQQNS